jgi:hypothetical protein
LPVAELAAETLALGDPEAVDDPVADELCEPQPTIKIAAAATIPPLREFRTICALPAI